MGAGGSVEVVGSLSFSGAEVRLTRGLFTTYNDEGLYSDDVLLENNGVIPDMLHDLTIEDFASNYVSYVKSFSDIAANLGAEGSVPGN